MSELTIRIRALPVAQQRRAAALRRSAAVSAADQPQHWEESGDAGTFATPLAVSAAAADASRTAALRPRLATALSIVCLAAMMLLSPGAGAQNPPAAAGASSFRVLVFSKTLGYRHPSITNGIAAIRELGGQNGFAVDASEDSGVFTTTNLARYATVVFLSATGNFLNPDQESAFKSYVLGGGGLAAVHGALFGPGACEDKWGWYGGIFCCAFTNHSRVMPAVVHLENAGPTYNAGLPPEWRRTDEWYNFTGTPRDCARVLATVDESTYSGGSMGRYHPVVWCRRVGLGRMWYTAMGHTESAFTEPLFTRHLLQGILLTAGKMPGDFAPNPCVVPTLAWQRQDGAIALTQDGVAVWQFNYGTNTPKPCFHPVAVPGGPVLTWDKPTDHPWHHALWFSWKFLNGDNYWEPEAKQALPKGRTQWAEPQIQTAPDYSAQIVMDLTYRLMNAPPVMTEHRVVKISPPNREDAYRMDWTLTFTAADQDVVLNRTPLPGEPGGQPWGGYAGLSVRFAKDIKDARAVMPESPVEFASGKYRGKAPAMDFTGIFDGREAGIAILDSPANVNSPSPWYAINDNSMRYFSPAVIQDGPHTLKAGQSFTLRYRVLVHPGRWSPGQLREAVDTYVAEQPSHSTAHK